MYYQNRIKTQLQTSTDPNWFEIEWDNKTTKN